MRLEFPRFVGNPYQYRVEDLDDYNKFVKDNNGVNDCYVAHNATPAGRDTVWLRYIPMDLDCNTGLEKPHEDIKRIKAWADEHGIHCQQVFSAGKGYHAYLEFKPVLVQDNDVLKGVYRGIQETIIEEAGVETSDPHVVGDTQRILRIPGTRHMRTGLYCNEVSSELVDSGLQKVLDYCDRPRKMLKAPLPRMTVKEFVKEHSIKPKKSSRALSGGEAEYFGGDDELLKEMLPRMCIHSAMASPNPGHLARFEAALTLMKAGHSPEFVTRFFIDNGTRHGWGNLDPAVTEYQVYNIARNLDRYNTFSCGRLKGEGLCVGRRCPIYDKVFGSKTNDIE